jgi:hypothetical protein
VLHRTGNGKYTITQICDGVIAWKRGYKIYNCYSVTAANNAELRLFEFSSGRAEDNTYVNPMRPYNFKRLIEKNRPYTIIAKFIDGKLCDIEYSDVQHHIKKSSMDSSIINLSHAHDEFAPVEVAPAEVAPAEVAPVEAPNVIKQHESDGDESSNDESNE